jgi:hypothetical protein
VAGRIAIANCQHQGLTAKRPTHGRAQTPEGHEESGSGLAFKSAKRLSSRPDPNPVPVRREIRDGQPSIRGIESERTKAWGSQDISGLRPVGSCRPSLRSRPSAGRAADHWQRLIRCNTNWLIGAQFCFAGASNIERLRVGESTTPLRSNSVVDSLDGSRAEKRGTLKCFSPVRQRPSAPSILHFIQRCCLFTRPNALACYHWRRKRPVLLSKGGPPPPGDNIETARRCMKCASIHPARLHCEKVGEMESRPCRASAEVRSKVSLTGSAMFSAPLTNRKERARPLVAPFEKLASARCREQTESVAARTATANSDPGLINRRRKTKRKQALCGGLAARLITRGETLRDEFLHPGLLLLEQQI